MDPKFLLHAIAYMAAAIVCVPIAKRLGLGSVLGYLCAGLLIGPAVIGVIGDEGKDIMHMAEFGVVIMLFLVGLELEPERIWRLRRVVAGAGGMQLAATAVLVSAVLALGGIVWQTAVAAALAIAMSSTAIVLQTLKEQGLSGTRAGRTSFAILLFQDIAVIPILAALPLLTTHWSGELSGDPKNFLEGYGPWLQGLVILGAITAVVAFGRFAVVPLMRFVARSRVRELFLAASLLIVVAITWTMTAVGLSPALGTFLAGVVLANSEFRHELESDLEPVKGLLLGLFFMAVGAGIDVALVSDNPLPIAASVTGIVVAKFLVLLAVGKLLKLRLDQSLILAVGLSQVGEFAFVLISYAVVQHVMTYEQGNFLIAVTAISMATTPILLLVLHRLILPRVGTKREPDREADDVDEHHRVIIVGFSHFGSTVGRFLRANGVEATILDNDSDRVDLLRRMGFRVYYGDAMRIDVLAAAGAESSSILVVAIDDRDATNQLVENVKKHFPHLALYVRSKHRFHTYDLMRLGIKKSYRESLDTSVRLGVDVLRALGYRAHSVSRSAQAFLRYDEDALEKLAPHAADVSSYVAQVREAVAEQEQLLLTDRMHDHTSADPAWDSAPLREKAGGPRDPRE